MLTAVAVAAAIQDMELKDLERFYWDCDTMFMEEGILPEYLKTCIDITIAFQQTFSNRDSFMEYWEALHRQEWNRRGYYGEEEQGE